VQQPDPHRIRSILTQAVTHGGSLRIRYFSPAAGYETERTIEPQVM
jgi:predicted DNA-binding transcriptional regulator YafY